MSSTGAVNSKWPDFRLASTLRNLLGSQSTASEGFTAINGASSNSKVHQQQREQEHEPVPDERRENDQNNLLAEQNHTMDSREKSIDENEDVDSYEHDLQMEESNDHADDDFGTLEMFDSNAVAAPYSSQLLGEAQEASKAPEAVMSEESSANKSKRDKKEGKKGETSDDASPQVQTEDGSVRKHKKSKKKSSQTVEIPDSLPLNNESIVEQDVPEEDTAVPGLQTKRKRKSSDSTEAKKRKKHKSFESDAGSQEIVPGTQQSAEAQFASQTDVRGSQGASFLRTRDPAQTAAIYDDIPDDSPTSPSDTRQSSRAKKDGAGVNPDQMDVDTNYNASQDLGTDNLPVNGSAAQDDHDVENLAREAWNEHISGQPHSDAIRPEEDLAVPTSAQRPQKSHDVYDVPASPTHNSNPPSTKRARSARAKKAKPTFFEKSPSPEIDPKDETLGLPSPSAATPKPRGRAKKASNRRKSEARRMQELQPDDVGNESDEAAAQGRRNRMAGFTQGRFSDEELGRIARAVEGYRSEHGLTSYQVNEMIHAAGGTTAGDDHAALWARVFATCPDRHRQKIINITRKKFHNFVARGTWTQEQDAELRDLIEVHGTKWSKIAGIINRHPEDLRDRYRNYIVCGEHQRKDAWSEEEEANLTQYVMEAMGAIDELRTQQPSRELLKKPYEELIDWQNISERMLRTRSRLQCITKWKSMNFKTHGRDKLVSQAPDSGISFRLEKARRQLAEMPDEERYRLVLAIHGVSAASESKIPWPKLVDKQFRMKWHRPTQMLLWRRLKQSVPDYEVKSVRDCTQYLLDQFNQTGELPNIDDDHFSASQETGFIATIPVSTVGVSHANAGQTRADGQDHDQQYHASNEYVFNSDDENEGQDQVELADNDAGINQTMVDVNIQPDLPSEAIDPALAMDSIPSSAPIAPMAPVDGEQPSEEIKNEPPPSSEPAPPRATRTAKRSGFGKSRPPPRKSTPAKRTSKRSAALAQDAIEDDGEPPVAPTDNTSEVELDRPRKRKTPSRFRSAAQVDRTRADDEDSVMDDMEDLPARVAV